jgi:LmbE family N-acetylglucosaminyl deacetylase
MRHVFVAPHPDDAALSCGGLIAALHVRGESIAIVSVYSGAGGPSSLTPYQREALGFADPGSRWAGESLDPLTAIAARHEEDGAYARLIGAEQAFVDLPDAVFRGYEGDDQLIGPPHSDDPVPVEALARALARLGPDRAYVPLSIGGHVDHRQVRRAAMELAASPGSRVRGLLRFYEDFPYTLTHGFEAPADLDPEVPAGLPPGFELAAEFVPIDGLIEAKLAGMRSYASQVDHLFGGPEQLAEAVHRQALRVGAAAGMGPAERYWRIVETGS